MWVFAGLVFLQLLVVAAFVYIGMVTSATYNQTGAPTTTPTTNGTTSAAANNNANGNNQTGETVFTPGLITGISVGGVVAVLVLVAVLYFLRKAWKGRGKSGLDNKGEGARAAATQPNPGQKGGQQAATQPKYFGDLPKSAKELQNEYSKAAQTFAATQNIDDLKKKIKAGKDLFSEAAISAETSTEYLTEIEESLRQDRELLENRNDEEEKGKT